MVWVREKERTKKGITCVIGDEKYECQHILKQQTLLRKPDTSNKSLPKTMLLSHTKSLFACINILSKGWYQNRKSPINISNDYNKN
jgi:hypothetical protein